MPERRGGIMKTTAAALLAVLSLGALAVTPAQAQMQRFGIFFGDEPEDFHEPEFAICLKDNQIRDRIAAYGYSNIALNVPDDKHVQVRASRDGAVYLLDFNYCTGEIEGRQLLRR
jgi:hypothetical protein